MRSRHRADVQLAVRHAVDMHAAEATSVVRPCRPGRRRGPDAAAPLVTVPPDAYWHHEVPDIPQLATAGPRALPVSRVVRQPVRVNARTVSVESQHTGIVRRDRRPWWQCLVQPQRGLTQSTARGVTTLLPAQHDPVEPRQQQGHGHDGTHPERCWRHRSFRHTTCPGPRQ